MAINVKNSAPGDVVDYTPASDVAAGEVVVQGELLGIALSPLQANRPGSLLVWGLVEAPKASGSISAGAIVYWDATNKVVTTTSTGNKRAGLAAETSSGSTIHVLWGR
jgi:predicted RecA/RadA family phage recombinase